MKYLKVFETTTTTGDPAPNYDEMLSFIEIYKKSIISIFNKTCGKDMELEIIQTGYYNYPVRGYISFPRYFARIWRNNIPIQKDIIKDFSIIIRLNIKFKDSYMEENGFKGKKTGKTIDAFYLKSKLTYYMLENMKAFLDALKNKNFVHRHEIGLRYNKIDIKMLYNPKDLRQKTRKVMKDINEDVIKDINETWIDQKSDHFVEAFNDTRVARQTISEKASEIKKFLKNSDIPYTRATYASGNIYFTLEDQNILNKVVKIAVKPSEITCKYLEYIEQSRRWHNKSSIRISYDETEKIGRFIAENFPDIIPKKNINKIFNDINEGMYDFMHGNTLDGVMNKNIEDIMGGINESMEQRKIDNVSKVIQYTIDVNAMDRWRPVQMNIVNKERNEDLIRFCEIFSKETKIEELGGMRREPSDKSFDFVASKANAGIGMSGIKVNHFPQMKIWEWEKWDDGYIEIFLRTDESYFIWQYVPMKHLRRILTEFQDDFIFWDYYDKPYK